MLSLASIKALIVQVRPKAQARNGVFQPPCRALWPDAAMSLPSSDSHPGGSQAEFVHSEDVQILTAFKSCRRGLVGPTANLGLDTQVLKSTGAENVSTFTEVLNRQARPVESILSSQFTGFYKIDIYS